MVLETELLLWPGSLHGHCLVCWCGGAPDGKEDAATVHQFPSYHQGIACKVVLVLVVGLCVDGCMVVYVMGG
jgi:hypothetical protein